MSNWKKMIECFLIDFENASIIFLLILYCCIYLHNSTLSTSSSVKSIELKSTSIYGFLTSNKITGTKNTTNFTKT